MTHRCRWQADLTLFSVVDTVPAQNPLFRHLRGSSLARVSFCRHNFDFWSNDLLAVRASFWATRSFSFHTSCEPTRTACNYDSWSTCANSWTTEFWNAIGIWQFSSAPHFWRSTAEFAIGSDTGTRFTDAVCSNCRSTKFGRPAS